MNLNQKKILVTGSSGFVGSHLTELLVENGAVVTAFVHSNGRNEAGLLPSDALAKVETFFGDISDPQAVQEAVKGQDIVLHLAAQISIPYSYSHPREVHHANATGTFNILQSSLEAGVKRVVITSTSEVYGSADNLPILESHPRKPQSPYAASKVAGDAYAKSFYASYGLPVVIARPFNTYGPRQSDRAVIPNVIKQALWGHKIKVGALHPKRDFLFVEDTASAFLACCDYENFLLNGEDIHFGTNTSYSVQDIIELVLEMTGVKKDVEVENYRLRPTQSEVKHLLCDYSKAKQLLGWNPQVSFRDGLKKVRDYMEANASRFKVDAYNV